MEITCDVFFFGGNGCYSWGFIVLRNYDQPELCIHRHVYSDTHKLVPLISAFGGESHLRTEASQWQVGPDLQAALEVRLADVDDW